MKWSKRIRTILIAGGFAFLAIRLAPIWIWPFNYYYEYNFLKRAVLDANCVIEHETVNQDVTLEEIEFTIRTASGWQLQMFFSDQRDMRQLCNRPEGIIFLRPGGHPQVYSLGRLKNELEETTVRLIDIGDILRNFDVIAPILRANYDDDRIPRTPEFSGAELRRYVMVYQPWKPMETESPFQTVYRTMQQRAETGPRGLPLRGIDFEVTKLNANGKVDATTTGHAMYYEELVGQPLEMVRIPAGEFLMGTSFQAATLVQAEYVRVYGEDFAEFWHEGPPRRVKVPVFYIGRFEVTQAQWRAASLLPKFRIDLPTDPSYFKGDQLPVEYISWEEATEFCDRLSIASGTKYRLPSEAEWEYACRAGSTSFYLGDAISTKFANYTGVYPYGSVGWGLNRDRTTPVGSFAPNAFGLHDMHDNVREFCEDGWHDTYEAAPADASAWAANDQRGSHSVYGGSYLNMPTFIRSASRQQTYSSTNKLMFCGFRVVSSKP
jgi:formylglycine-generating enzyme required for sulfatase activity